MSGCGPYNPAHLICSTPACAAAPSACNMVPFDAGCACALTLLVGLLHHASECCAFRLGVCVPAPRRRRFRASRACCHSVRRPCWCFALLIPIGEAVQQRG
eukprot:362070-Chlamydomonas_euryale.AAC.18